MEDTNFPGEKARVSEVGRADPPPDLAMLPETHTMGKRLKSG